VLGFESLASQINTRYAPLGWTIAGAVISGGGRNLFDSAAGDAGDEAIEEEVIGDRHRDAGEQRAAMISPQKMSPRMRSVATPSVTGF
jgi:hypothetical protein